MVILPAGGDAAAATGPILDGDVGLIQQQDGIPRVTGALYQHLQLPVTIPRDHLVLPAPSASSGVVQSENVVSAVGGR